jgi:hypothetical protein
MSANERIRAAPGFALRGGDLVGTPILRRLLGLGCLLAAVSAGPPLRAQGTPTTEGRSAPARGKAGDDRTLAGLPADGRPEVLTWERAYTLALVRCRSPRPAALADSLDPKQLAEQAQRLGVGDFERFGDDFLGRRAGAPPFVDPSAPLFDLFRRLQAVDSTRALVDALEDLKREFEAMQAEAQAPARPVRLERWLEHARAQLTEELGAYRQQLDKVKAELGLSPKAPVIPDRTSLARFRTVFEKADAWFGNPERARADLPRLASQLPALADRLPGPLSLAGVSTADPERLAAVVDAADQILARNRGPLDEAARAGVHRRIEHLAGLLGDYRKETEQWRRALEAKDQAFEQLLAPPRPGAVVQVPDLIGLHAGILQSEARLVALWASYHAERLALARDLRVMPARDWPSFLAQVAGSPAGPAGQ